MRKCLLLLLALLPAALVTGGTRYWRAHKEYCYKVERGRHITRENYYRIFRESLNWGQTKAVLGGPPGDFRTRPIEYGPLPKGLQPQDLKDIPTNHEGQRRSTDSWAVKCWSSDEGRIMIAFDDDGLQGPMGFQRAPTPAPGPKPWWRQLLDRLGL